MDAETDADLPDLPDDWSRALVLMAHPDDPEYGVGAAVARWTSEGRDVRYVLATHGEAGIAGLEPRESAVLRAREQRASCERVGVSSLELLDLPDGVLVEGPALRRDVASAIRRHRPELVVTLNHHDSWPFGGWNTADHRALGRCVLDAVADAANEWVHRDLAAAGLAPWRGVRRTAVAASPRATHQVDVTAHLEDAVASLREHRRYLEALSDDPVEQQARAVVAMSTGAGEQLDGRGVVRFEVVGG
ncbi:PIG-L deacetylase family protein [uncultured Pseudokineococcus sp.]|uniref:PIG-L deacetylase family protein n=1 Tax=uncultured Pseudokineococcus sp. TaxID=1642928 RepID=UPI002612DC4B|nr:PIG-L deacetylase family protein [uncultured Pseudokineococcus sp.]